MKTKSKSNKNRISLSKFAILLILAVAAAIGLMCIVYSNYIIYDYQEKNMYLTVDNYVGFNAANDSIYFGTVPLGGSASRNIVLKHSYSKPLFVQLKPSGYLSNFVSVSDNNFILEPNKNKIISVSVYVPKNMEYGNYTGKLAVVYRKI
jgi:hypothetical protein